MTIAKPVTPPAAKSDGIRKKYMPKAVINNPKLMIKNDFALTFVFNISPLSHNLSITHNFIILS